MAQSQSQNAHAECKDLEKNRQEDFISKKG